MLLLGQRTENGPNIIQAAATALELPGAHIAANAHTGGLPADEHPTPYGLNPPDEWLMSLPTEITASGVTTIDPYLTGPYIDAEGRVAIFAWGYGERGTCHNGSPLGEGVCWKPTPSPTGNRLFHQGTIITASGVSVPAGGLMVGHAASGSVLQAQQYYNSPDLFKVRGRILETDLGAYLVGTLQPGTTNNEVEILRVSALSGDWRRMPELGGAFDSLGPVVVARPALPSFGDNIASGTPQPTIDTVFWELVSQFVPEGITASGEFSSVSQRHVWQPVQETNMPTDLRRKIQRIAAAGITSRARLDLLETALRTHLGVADDQYLWANDFDDTHVYYEVEDTGMMALPFSMTAEGAVTIQAVEPQPAIRSFTIGAVDSAPAVPTETTVPAPAAAPAAVQAAGSNCSCPTGRPCGSHPTNQIRAAAESLETAANQSDMDTVMEAIAAMNERLDLIDTDIVQLKAESLTADDTADETSGEIESS